MTETSPAGTEPSLSVSMARKGAARSLIALARPAGGTNGVLAIMILVLCAGFAAFLPHGSIGPGTLQSMMFQLPELALLSLAMSVAILSGGLNLAIIATANATALLMAVVVHALAPADGGTGGTLLAVLVAMGVGLCLAVAIGAITGLLIASLGLNPLLVTLGTMSLIGGLSVTLTRGGVISGFPEMLLALGNTSFFYVPVSFVLLLVVFGLVAALLSRTAFGISVRMLGSNPEATKFSGVSEVRALVGVYVLSSVLCWSAGLVMMARFNSASAGYAGSYLLITILAAVLGGLNPYGGFGKIGGLLLGLVLLQLISTGFTLLGLDQHVTNVIWGAMLLVVMSARKMMSN